MSRLIPLLIAIASVTACSTPSDPEKALQNYARAVIDRRCDDALKYLSSRTIYAIDALRIEPQNRWSTVPIEEYYCSRFAFEHCKWKETVLDNRDGDKANVSMMCGRTQDSILPGFTSIFLKYETRVTELISEEGEWRVPLPHVIRIVEVRESEQRMIETELQKQSELKRRNNTRSRTNVE